MPTIRFNSSFGSDTTASGSAGAIVANGTNASYSGSVFTLDGSPDLSGFAAADDILWVDTSSGRQFFDITSVDNGAKTVTVVDAPAGTSTGLTWGIGGKRATFDNADSRNLWNSNNAKTGWIIETETDQTISSSAITLSATNFTTRGSSGSIKTISQSANTSCWSNAAAGQFVFENLKFECTNATRTSAAAISLNSTAVRLTAVNCVFGDSTNTLAYCLRRPANTPVFHAINCIFQYCTVEAISCGGGGGCTLYGNVFRHNEKDVVAASTGSCTIVGNLFYDANSTSVELTGAINTVMEGNTFYGAGGDNILISAASVDCRIINNIIAGSGSGYGINLTGGGTALVLHVDYNNFGTGGTANSSGPASSNVTLGPNDVTVDPQFGNAGTYDFSVGTSMKAAATPISTATMGLSLSNTYTFRDIGAAQREEPAGGGGGGPLVGPGRLARN